MVHRLLEIVQDVYSDIMSPPMPAGYEPTAPVVWNEREIKVQGPEEEPIAKQAALKRKNHHKPDFHMPIDLIEDEQRFKIYVDIPGVDKNKNLSLSLNEEGDVLSIEAEKKVRSKALSLPSLGVHVFLPSFVEESHPFDLRHSNI